MQLHIQDSHTDRAVNAVRRASPFALIHDDGDHSYEGALADLDLYSPLVMDGGVLVVDGVHGDETVFDAVQTFLAKYPQWHMNMVGNFGFGDDAILRRTPAGDRMTPRIPRTIHQIWLGPEPRPRQWMQTWLDHHPGWEYRLWTDESLPVLTNNRLFESFGSLWHGKADVARYEILHRFGGVYIDADSECVRPLDERLLACEAFACFENESLRPGVIANGFMGAVPGSRLTRALIEAMSRESLRANLPPWRVTGPTLLTAVASRLEATALTIYPSYFFLPTHYTGEQYRGDGPVYAIHHWSTTKREARARAGVKSLPRRALRRAFEAWTKIAGGE